MTTDEWILALVRKWERHDPMHEYRGDTEAVLLARRSLKTFMEHNGFDIYGGSSEPQVKAMNYAWKEGFITGFLAGYKPATEEQ